LLFCGWDMQVPSKTMEGENERDAVWYSDDGGATYKMANATASADFRGMDECQMAELQDGRVMIVLRHDNQLAPCSGPPPSPPPPPCHSKECRKLARCKAVAYSSDSGASFGNVSYVAALESGSDEASVLGLGDTLFYSGAADHSTTGAPGTYGRKNFTVRAPVNTGSLPLISGGNSGINLTIPIRRSTTDSNRGVDCWQVRASTDSGQTWVSRRFPLIPRQNCLFTSELQWQSRGK
jgi:hypothetical protein